MTTLTAVASITLAFSIGYVIRAIGRTAAYRQRREPLPTYYAGNIASGLATVFLLGSVLANEHEALQWVCLVAALICLSIDWRQTRAALHRNDKGPAL